MKILLALCALAVPLYGCTESSAKTEERTATQETTLQELVNVRCNSPTAGVCTLYFSGRTADGAHPQLEVIATPNADASAFSIIVIEYRGRSTRILPGLPDYCQKGASPSCKQFIPNVAESKNTV